MSARRAIKSVMVRLGNHLRRAGTLSGMRLHLCGLVKPNKLFYSFWLTPRRGETLRVSTRHRPSDLWVLAGALTFHIGLHCLRCSDMFHGERDRENRSRSMVGDMIPWFYEALKWRFLGQKLSACSLFDRKLYLAILWRLFLYYIRRVAIYPSG
jgi:hypothetical protein